MALRESAYVVDQTFLKVFGFGENKRIKLTRMFVCKNRGIEGDAVWKDRRFINDFKLEPSIIRAKSKIFELAFCNPWSWFFTATLDLNKQDRANLDLWHKQLTQWLRDYNKKFSLNLKYLLIPELHSDGVSWHMHGFLYDLPVAHLRRFLHGDVMGKSLADKVKRGDVVYNWPAYAKRFGFCDLEPIRNPEAVSKYITKYINKNLALSVTDLHAHLYYHSRGLAMAETIKIGTMSANIVPDYENEYCQVAWYDYSEELLQKLVDSFHEKRFVTK